MKDFKEFDADTVFFKKNTISKKVEKRFEALHNEIGLFCLHNRSVFLHDRYCKRAFENLLPRRRLPPPMPTHHRRHLSAPTVVLTNAKKKGKNRK